MSRKYKRHVSQFDCLLRVMEYEKSKKVLTAPAIDYASFPSCFEKWLQDASKIKLIRTSTQSMQRHDHRFLIRRSKSVVFVISEISRSWRQRNVVSSERGNGEVNRECPGKIEIFCNEYTTFIVDRDPILCKDSLDSVNVALSLLILAHAMSLST